MRQCHIDECFNFFKEEEVSPQDKLKNTLQCDDDLYEAIVAMQVLYDVSYKFDLTFLDDEFHDAFDRLKAKVLMDEIERFKRETVKEGLDLLAKEDPKFRPR